jgi:hypothetical protein
MWRGRPRVPGRYDNTFIGQPVKVLPNRAEGLERMCQQWLSVLGLVFDVVGILTIAVEWRHTFERDVHIRQKRIERDYRKSVAESRGEKLDDDEDLDYTMWRPFQRLLRQEVKLILSIAARIVYVNGDSVMRLGMERK